VIGIPPLDHTLFLGLVASATLSCALLVVEPRRPAPAGSYLGGPEADGAHLVMNLAMAVMLTPWFTGAGRSVILAVFAALAATFAIALVAGVTGRSGYWSARRTMSGYHLVAAAVMAYATVVHTSGTSPGLTHVTAMPGMGHAGHSSGSTPVDAVMSAPSTMAWILAALFTLDAVGTAVTVTVLPAGAIAAATSPNVAHASSAGSAIPAASAGTRPQPASVRRLRVSAVPHVLMDLAMAVMLVGPAIR
jgi:hypothetical protein